MESWLTFLCRALQAARASTAPIDPCQSGALVILVLLAAVPGRQRGSRWPADSDSAGDVKPTRWPMGEPVILWAFGLPFLPVYADYYVFTGSKWRHYLWLLDKKTRHESLPTRGLRFGQFLASVPTTPTDNMLHLDIDSGEHDFQFNHTDLVAVFLHDGITLTKLPNVAGLQSQSGPKAMLVMDRP
jgi:hypothetical protein